MRLFKGKILLPARIEYCGWTCIVVTFLPPSISAAVFFEKYIVCKINGYDSERGSWFWFISEYFFIRNLAVEQCIKEQYNLTSGFSEGNVFRTSVTWKLIRTYPLSGSILINKTLMFSSYTCLNNHLTAV